MKAKRFLLLLVHYYRRCLPVPLWVAGLLGLLLVSLSASRDASQELGANYAVPSVLLLVFSLVTAPLLVLPSSCLQDWTLPLSRRRLLHLRWLACFLAALPAFGLPLVGALFSRAAGEHRALLSLNGFLAIVNLALWVTLLSAAKRVLSPSLWGFLAAAAETFVLALLLVPLVWPECASGVILGTVVLGLVTYLAGAWWYVSCDLTPGVSILQSSAVPARTRPGATTFLSEGPLAAKVCFLAKVCHFRLHFLSGIIVATLCVYSVCSGLLGASLPLVVWLLLTAFVGKVFAVWLRRNASQASMLARSHVYHASLLPLLLLWFSTSAWLYLAPPSFLDLDRRPGNYADELWGFARKLDPRLSTHEVAELGDKDRAAWSRTWSERVKVHCRNVTRDYADRFGIRADPEEIMEGGGGAARILPSRLRPKVLQAHGRLVLSGLLVVVAVFLLGLAQDLSRAAGHRLPRRIRPFRAMLALLHPAVLYPLLTVSTVWWWLSIRPSSPSPLRPEEIMALGDQLLPLTTEGMVRMFLVQGFPVVVPALLILSLLLYFWGRTLFRYAELVVVLPFGLSELKAR